LNEASRGRQSSVISDIQELEVEAPSHLKPLQQRCRGRNLKYGKSTGKAEDCNVTPGPSTGKSAMMPDRDFSHNIQSLISSAPGPGPQSMSDSDSEPASEPRRRLGRGGRRLIGRSGRRPAQPGPGRGSISFVVSKARTGDAARSRNASSDMKVCICLFSQLQKSC
jgi:hypothetical protein